MAEFFVHESSYVDDGAQVGRGTKIWHFCHVMSGAVIGERCNLGQNVVVMPARRVGWMCECGEGLVVVRGAAACASCGTAYEESTSALHSIAQPRGVR